LSPAHRSLIAVLLLAILAFTLSPLNVARAENETSTYNAYTVRLKQEIFVRVNFYTEFFDPKGMGGYVEFKGVVLIELNITSELVKGNIVFDCKDCKAYIYNQSGYTQTPSADVCNLCMRVNVMFIPRSFARYISELDPRQTLIDPLRYGPGPFCLTLLWGLRDLYAGGFATRANVYFNGTEYYRGYPAVVYTITLRNRSSVPWFGSEYSLEREEAASGRSYVYAGFPIPLSGTLTGKVRLYDPRARLVEESSFEISLETISLELSFSAPYAYSDQGDFVVVTGGLPGAKIAVRYVEGERKLIVVNNGTEAGYVSIIYRSASGLEQAVTPSEAPGSTINYAIKPGEVKEIPVRVALKSDLALEARSPSSAATTIPVTIILAVVVSIVVVLVLKRLRRKPGVTVSETPLPAPAPSQSPSTSFPR